MYGSIEFIDLSKKLKEKIDIKQCGNNIRHGFVKASMSIVL